MTKRTDETALPLPYSLEQIIAYACATISILEKDKTPSGLLMIREFVSRALDAWAEERAKAYAYYEVQDYKRAAAKGEDTSRWD